MHPQYMHILIMATITFQALPYDPDDLPHILKKCLFFIHRTGLAQQLQRFLINEYNFYAMTHPISGKVYPAAASVATDFFVQHGFSVNLKFNRTIRLLDVGISFLFQLMNLAFHFSLHDTYPNRQDADSGHALFPQ
jgi:hypothetical protein